MATENPWADLVFGLAEGCALLADGRAAASVAYFERAAAAASSLGAPVVAAWAGAAASLGLLPAAPESASSRARRRQPARSFGRLPRGVGIGTAGGIGGS